MLVNQNECIYLPLFLFLSSSSDTLIVGGRNMNTLTIELPKETLEKLSLLQQAYKKKTGTVVTESTLIQSLISREFIQEVTPFDLQEYVQQKEQR